MNKRFLTLWLLVSMTVTIVVAASIFLIVVIINLFGPWSPFVIMLLMAIAMVSYFIADSMEQSK